MGVVAVYVVQRKRAGRAERERRKADDDARRGRIARMSAEEYRREAEADPVYRDWLRRREAETEAELRRLKGELAEGGEPGA